MRYRTHLLAGAAVLQLLIASEARAQVRPAGRDGADARRPCAILITGVRRGAEATRVRVYTGAGGARVTYVGGGVDATCAGQDNRLLADSAEHYEDRGLLILFRNVRYTEPRVRLTSDRMTYYTTDERLLAEGNVHGVTPSGTRFTGPRMEYFRPKPGVRAESRLIATGRPFVRMAPEQSRTPRTPRILAGVVQSDSVDLHAEQVTTVNDSLVWASGKVVIERHDILARSDSAYLDQGVEFARLLREPSIVGRGDRTFTLTGTVLDLWSKEGELTRVRADGRGRVVSDSLTLAADTIDMRLASQQLERVFTWGGRSRAETPSQRIDADSLDVRMPAQRLRELHAVGSARATSVADSATMSTDERDWIAGDTLVAEFDTAAVADSSDQPKMRRVVATGSARSFYQLASNDSAKGPPSISYNRGRVITLAFDDGEVSTVDVIGGAAGVYLEPTRPEGTPASPGARPAVPNPPAATPVRRP